MKVVGNSLNGNKLAELTSSEFRALKSIASLMRGETVDNTRSDEFTAVDMSSALEAINHWIFMKYNIAMIRKELGELDDLLTKAPKK